MSEEELRLVSVLEPFVTSIVAKAVVERLRTQHGLDVASLDADERPMAAMLVLQGVSAFISDETVRSECRSAVQLWASNLSRDAV